jgi:pimeloyl-ACP methyl ester carboxylesterase
MLTRMERNDHGRVHELRVERPDGTVLIGEVRGAPGHPLVLLVAGGDCPMDWWRPEFCAAIAERGFRVVRYDQRGTGQTTLGPREGRRAGLEVAVDDALAVLDAAAAAGAADADGAHGGAAAAHWAGFSSGGWIAQLAALDHPTRVRALTLMSTRPAWFGEPDADLPEPSSRLQARWANPLPEPDWSDPDAIIEYRVETDRDYAGDEFDEAHDRAIWTDTVRRAPGRPADDDLAAFADPPRWRERLGEIRVPTTVLHGTADPMFPFANGEALARDIPGARFVPLPGIGHELPPPAWDAVIDAVAR